MQGNTAAQAARGGSSASGSSSSGAAAKASTGAAGRGRDEVVFEYTPGEDNGVFGDVSTKLGYDGGATGKVTSGGAAADGGGAGDDAGGSGGADKRDGDGGPVIVQKAANAVLDKSRQLAPKAAFEHFAGAAPLVRCLASSSVTMANQNRPPVYAEECVEGGELVRNLGAIGAGITCVSEF